MHPFGGVYSFKEQRKVYGTIASTFFSVRKAETEESLHTRLKRNDPKTLSYMVPAKHSKIH